MAPDVENARYRVEQPGRAPPTAYRLPWASISSRTIGARPLLFTSFQLLPRLVDRSTLAEVLQSPTVARHAALALAATRSRSVPATTSTSPFVHEVVVAEGVRDSEGFAVGEWVGVAETLPTGDADTALG